MDERKARKETLKIMAKAIFDSVNAQKCGGSLPTPAFEVSGRMTRGLGKYIYSRTMKPANWRDPKTGQKYRLIIRLSEGLLNISDTQPNQVFETVVHEMAHHKELVETGQILRVRQGHSEIFRLNCKILGCKPGRYASIGVEKEDGNYVYFCKSCCVPVRCTREIQMDEDARFCDCGGKRYYLAEARELKNMMDDLRGILYPELRDYEEAAQTKPKIVKSTDYNRR